MATPESFLAEQILTNDPPPPAALAAPEPSARRRPAKRKAKTVDVDYDTVALTTAEWGEVAFWAGIWALDAWFTATFLALVFGLALPFGFAIHVMVSFVQQHLWRLGWREHALPVLVLAAANIGTSVIGLWTLLGRWFPMRPFDVFGRATTVPAATVLFYGAIVVALVIAVAPERHLSKYLRSLLGR
jgi:hypothetical protein